VSLTRRYTGGDYLNANPGWHLEDAPWKAARILEAFDRGGLRPSTIIEIGTGAGGILAELTERIPGATFTGFDISEQAIALAKRREGPRLRFVVGDGVDDDNGPADVALVIDVIEHVPDPNRFLRAIAGRARMFVFHIPLDFFALAVLQNRPLNQWREQVGHLHSYTRDLAVITLREAGYDIIDEAYTPSSFAFPPAGLKTRLLQLVRRRAFRWRPNLAVRVLGGYSLIVVARPPDSGHDEPRRVASRAAGAGRSTT
jgi:SAM-dependent methyltransferase